MIRYPFPPHAKVDEMVMAVCFAVFLMTAAWVLGRRIRDTEKRSIPSKPVDNVEGIAMGIALQINRCTNDKELNAALGAIRIYEARFCDDPVAREEARELKLMLDIKAAEIYECA